MTTVMNNGTMIPNVPNVLEPVGGQYFVKLEVIVLNLRVPHLRVTQCANPISRIYRPAV